MSVSEWKVLIGYYNLRKQTDVLFKCCVGCNELIAKDDHQFVFSQINIQLIKTSSNFLLFVSILSFLVLCFHQQLVKGILLEIITEKCGCCLFCPALSFLIKAINLFVLLLSFMFHCMSISIQLKKPPNRFCHSFQYHLHFQHS